MEEKVSSAEQIQVQTPVESNGKGLKKFFIVLIVILTSVGIIAFSLVIYTQDNGRIVDGVVLEIPLGNLSLEEADIKLETLRTELYARLLSLRADEKIISIGLGKLGLNYSYEEPLQQASGG